MLARLARCVLLAMVTAKLPDGGSVIAYLQLKQLKCTSHRRFAFECGGLVPMCMDDDDDDDGRCFG